MQRYGLWVAIGVLALLAGCSSNNDSGKPQAPAVTTTDPAMGPGGQKICDAVPTTDLQQIFGNAVQARAVLPGGATCTITTGGSNFVAAVAPTVAPEHVGDSLARIRVGGHPALYAANRLDISLAQDTAAAGDLWITGEGDETKELRYAARLVAIFGQGPTDTDHDLPPGPCAAVSTTTISALFGGPVTTNDRPVGRLFNCEYSTAAGPVTIDVEFTDTLNPSGPMLRRFTYAGHSAFQNYLGTAISLGTGNTHGVLHVNGTGSLDAKSSAAMRQLAERLLPSYAQ